MENDFFPRKSECDLELLDYWIRVTLESGIEMVIKERRADDIYTNGVVQEYLGLTNHKVYAV